MQALHVEKIIARVPLVGLIGSIAVSMQLPHLLPQQLPHYLVQSLEITITVQHKINVLKMKVIVIMIVTVTVVWNVEKIIVLLGMGTIIAANNIGLEQWQAHCFSAQFGFSCLDLDFLNSCWVKNLADRKDALMVVIAFFSICLQLWLQ